MSDESFSSCFVICKGLVILKTRIHELEGEEELGS